MVQEIIEIMFAITITMLLSIFIPPFLIIKNCPVKRPDSFKNSVNSIKYYKRGKPHCQAEITPL